MLGLQKVSKSSILHENTRTTRLKNSLRNLFKRENFKPETEPMIENLKKKLHQEESKQSKSANILASSRWGFEGEKYSKTYPKKLQHKICKIKQCWTICSVIMMIKAKNIPVNQRTFLNQIKTFSKTTNTREDISKTTIFEVLSKISYRNKISKQPLWSYYFSRRSY